MSDQYNEFVNWVLETKKLPNDFCHRQDLVDSGILDSLFFVEYILMIQELSGREVEVGEALLEMTRTLEKVQQHYFQ